MLRAFLFLMGGVVFSLLLLEGACRVLPVMAGWQNPPISEEYPFVRNEPNGEYVYSGGWDLRNVVRGTFNSVGFASPEPRDDTNVAVVGDSFIEASMLAPDERIAPVINASNPALHAVSFGRAGADIPDYLVVGNWVAHRYKPETMIFVISERDLQNGISPKRRGYWFQISASNDITLKNDTQFGIRNRVLSSRLASYIIYNLKFGPSMVFPMLNGQEEVKKNVALDEKALAAAADKFLDGIDAIQKQGTRVILAFDADRHAIYEGKQAVHTKDFDLLAPRAVARGVTIYDLSIPFKAEYEKVHQPFDFGRGEAHWNAYGSSLVAKSLASFIAALNATKETS